MWHVHGHGHTRRSQKLEPLDSIPEGHSLQYAVMSQQMILWKAHLGNPWGTLAATIPKIMVHHSEGYLSQKWAFCLYFVQLAWSKTLEPLHSIPEGRSLPYAVMEPTNDPIKGTPRSSRGHTSGYNPRIMVHHSEGYLPEKWAFCVYFVQLAWSKTLEPTNSITAGCSLRYTDTQSRNDPTKGPSRESMGQSGGCNPRIMVHHSEGYLSEKWAFCVYFVQLAWSETLEPTNSITAAGRSLAYTGTQPRNDPTKGAMVQRKPNVIITVTQREARTHALVAGDTYGLSPPGAATGSWEQTWCFPLIVARDCTPIVRHVSGRISAADLSWVPRAGSADEFQNVPCGT